MGNNNMNIPAGMARLITTVYVVMAIVTTVILALLLFSPSFAGRWQSLLISSVAFLLGFNILSGRRAGVEVVARPFVVFFAAIAYGVLTFFVGVWAVLHVQPGSDQLLIYLLILIPSIILMSLYAAFLGVLRVCTFVGGGFKQ
jgi:hypothetical protein